MNCLFKPGSQLLALVLLCCWLGGAAGADTGSGGAAGGGKATPADGKKFGEWALDRHDDLLRDITHGTEVWGHQFGLLRKLHHCDEPIIWVEWSTTKVHAKDLKQGSTVSLELNAGGSEIPVELELMAARQLTPHTTVFVLTNFAVNDNFTALLRQSKSVRLRIIGPAAFLQMLDLDADTFSLEGYEQADAAVTRLCRKLSGI